MQAELEGNFGWMLNATGSDIPVHMDLPHDPGRSEVQPRIPWEKQSGQYGITTFFDSLGGCKGRGESLPAASGLGGILRRDHWHCRLEEAGWRGQGGGGKQSTAMIFP
jgi:hypothetical protein